MNSEKDNRKTHAPSQSSGTYNRGNDKSEISLHIVKSLIRLPSIHTLGLVGIVVNCPGSGLRLVHGVVRGGFIGHPIIPEEYQIIINYEECSL